MTLQYTAEQICDYYPMGSPKGFDENDWALSGP